MSTESQPGSNEETTALRAEDTADTTNRTDPSTTTPDGANSATSTMTRPDQDTSGTHASATTSPGTHTTQRRRSWTTPPWIGTRTGDIGLLVLRLTLATSFIAHGLQKLGFFGGPGVAQFSQALAGQYGYRFPLVLSYVNSLTELVGGVLVAVGFLTPLAATGLMAVMINSTLLKFSSGFFFQQNGYEIDVVLGGLAAGLVLAGAGRIALDAKVPGMLRLQSLRWVFLVIGIAASLVVYFVLRTG